MNRNAPFLILCLALGACLDPSKREPSGDSDSPPVDTGPFDDDGDGYASVDGDCDDADPDVHPAAEDTVGDGVDQDCDGIDGVDADGDGYASEESGGSDCDDSDADQHPGAADVVGNGVDDDCDGVDGVDADGDGWAGEESGGEDCDDASPTTFPGAFEYRDTVDNDCDGQVDLFSLGAAEAIFTTDDTDVQNLGLTLSGAGDTNGDGFADLILGARYHSTGGELYNGAIYLVHGPVTGSQPVSGAAATLVGAESYDFLGGSGLDSVGDLDGDGLDDILVGSQYEDSGCWGAAYLVLGGIEGEHVISDVAIRITGTEFSSSVGFDVAGIGDLGGDGQPDFVIGAAGYERGRGAAYVFEHVLESDVSASNADLMLTGASEGDMAGCSVASAGDTDGDGLGDLLVGAFHASVGGLLQSGCVYLVTDATSGVASLQDVAIALQGTQREQELGYARSLADGGDLNADGYDDLVIGSPYFDTDVESAGAVFVLLGPVVESDSLASADTTITGEDYSDKFGMSVAVLGDVSGDGHSDLLVGAPDTNEVSTSAGTAYLFTGPVEGSLVASGASARMLGEGFQAYAGYAVDLAGDVDADGIPDMLIGAHGDARTYLVLGPGY